MVMELKRRLQINLTLGIIPFLTSFISIWEVFMVRNPPCFYSFSEKGGCNCVKNKISEETAQELNVTVVCCY